MMKDFSDGRRSIFWGNGAIWSTHLAEVLVLMSKWFSGLSSYHKVAFTIVFNHSKNVTLTFVAMLEEWLLLIDPDWNTTIRLSMTFCTDFHRPQGTHSHFSDPTDFTLSSTLTFSELSQQLLLFNFFGLWPNTCKANDIPIIQMSTLFYAN